MRVLLIIIFSVLSFAAIIYTVPPFHNSAADLLSYSKCEEPTKYRLGLIDSRFNLSREEAMDTTRQATAIWSSTEGRELFAYSEKASLTINFVYDRRQELDSKISQLDEDLRQKNTTLQKQISDYEAKAADFEKRFNQFNAKVDKYNREGGAPPDIYDQLIKEQNELDAEGDALNARAKELNLSTSNYNAGVSELNQNVNQFNTAIVEKPEEGLFDGESNTITIYFVNDRNELIHTLTHEFGHALGMDHVNDPQAIMYPSTTDFLAVTKADNELLSFACREKPMGVHLLEVFRFWLGTTVKNIQSAG
jgi:peptidoglycan hydrolase CwlO-like protein